MNELYNGSCANLLLSSSCFDGNLVLFQAEAEERIGLDRPSSEMTDETKRDPTGKFRL